MKNNTKHYLIAGIISALIVFATYIFPFMLSGIGTEGYRIAWEQYLISFIFLLPTIVLFIKKPNSLWVYSYPAIILVSMLVGIAQGDALGAGLLMLFIAVPIAIVYSILVSIKIIK